MGALTFELLRGSERLFAKWAPVTSGIDLSAEAARLSWAVEYTPVPRVIDHGAFDDEVWLVLTALPGESAVSDRWKREPETAVRAIGVGLRAFHDALPVSDCPFSWSAHDRVAGARRRAANGEVDPKRWHPEHQHLSVDEALDILSAPAPVDRLVVCHGDACAPNTLLSDDGGWSGHVDLGWLGIADRWADLAVATWSTVWNYGEGWEDILLDAYGVEADEERRRYYRLLWDLGP